MRAKRPGIKEAIQWIADNDEPGETDPEAMAELVTVLMVSDIFGLPEEEIARRVLIARKKSRRGSETKPGTNSDFPLDAPPRCIR
jgi:hypothetical protein